MMSTELPLYCELWTVVKKNLKHLKLYSTSSSIHSIHTKRIQKAQNCSQIIWNSWNRLIILRRVEHRTSCFCFGFRTNNTESIQNHYMSTGTFNMPTSYQ